MIWSLVLPIQVAVLTCVFLFMICLWGFLWKNRNLFGAVWRSCLVVLIAALPVLSIQWVCIDFFRFGKFHYLTKTELGSTFLAEFVPDHATEIQLETHSNWHSFEYTVPEKDLSRWVKKFSDKAISPVAVSEEEIRGVLAETPLWNGLWKPEDCWKFTTTYDTGGGPLVFIYNRKEMRAFHRFNYW